MATNSGAPTLTLIRGSERECVEMPAARIRLRGPDREDICFDLGLAPVVVGSSPECDIVVDEPYVSRRHCEFVRTPRGVVVRDLGSRNGVWMQTTRLLEAIITPGGNVTLGNLTLTLETQTDPVRVALSQSHRFGEAIGKSVVMRALFAVLEKAAQTNEPILMLGESGTGKELLAQAIHHASTRSKGPFVIFDCGAVAPSLVETELFGHEKGAFSGAHTSRTGLVQAAHGGTLFLDELGELPLDLQPKLLRVLESRTVRPVGSNQTIPVDVRIVVATHRDVRQKMTTGEFRQDLYYRLAVVEVNIPPLRERRDDIPLLVEHMLTARNPPCTLADLPPNTLDMLMAHVWPGNVRELRNTLSRILLFQSANALSLLDSGEQASVSTPNPVPLNIPFHEARNALVADFERRYITAQLRAHGASVTAAAKAMGVSRQFLHKLIAEHGVKNT